MRAYDAANPRQKAQLPLLGLEPPQALHTAALRSFHVRSHIEPGEALAGEAKARGQDAMVLAVFERAGRGARLTPSQVHAILVGDVYRLLLTSVRRSLTNATTAGRLLHWPGDRRPGPYGARESTWGLA